MKKLYVYVALAAMGVMAACSKNDNVDPQGNGGNTVIDDNSPVAVQLGVRGLDADVSVASKGGGGIDAWDAKQDLVVYAFDKSVTDYSTGEAFIDGVTAKSPADGEEANKVLDLKNAESNDEPFYYGGDNVYEFFGYHVDDATAPEATVQKATDRIYIPIQINGTQDLLVAKADPATDITAAAVENPDASDVDPQYVYSAYAARRGIQPTLAFNHLLTRFKFKIVAGADDANNIQVTKLSLGGKYKAEMNVVGDAQGLANITDTDTTNFVLMEKGVDGLQPLTAVSPNSYVAERNNPKEIGESIMVFPGETTYWLTLEMKDPNITQQVPALIRPINFADIAQSQDGDEAFMAGKQYTVTIVIYGLQKVEVSATLTPWDNVEEEITIDPDDKPVINNDDQQGGQGGGE